jgi:hypothetical protein
MKTLIKTIEGADCAIYVIKHHQRFFVSKATPVIEIYQNATEIKTIGSTNGQRKTSNFSLIICTNADPDEKMTADELRDTSHFDLTMLLPRKDEVFVPFEFAGLTDVSIEPGNRWVFDVNDQELTQKLLAL